MEPTPAVVLALPKMELLINDLFRGVVHQMEQKECNDGIDAKEQEKVGLVAHFECSFTFVYCLPITDKRKQ